MRFIFIGPPGAGKGTVAKILSRRFSIPHISTGDLLRAHIQQKSELGRQAAAFVDQGKLVPDALVIEMVRTRLKEPDASQGYILDGFPRTVEQAEALGKILRDEGMVVEHILNFDASNAKIIERLSGRRICSKCGEIYHVRNIPPKKEGLCDRCGGELIQRKDDSEDTVRRRLEVYRRETAPLIDYYNRMRLLKDLPADLEVAELNPILDQLVK
ncbi:MAG: adenylate kinase [Candidatus Omnitrophica bacterium]|nr:adenylate kinase [Candidatus Omnitrophota bacterium]